MTAPSRYRLGVDLGTSTTIAMLQWPDGRVRPLLFDSSPLLASGVLLGLDGRLHTGRDAAHFARANPERLEPNPKRRVDDTTVLLGDTEVPVLELLTTVLRRVAMLLEEQVRGSDLLARVGGEEFAVLAVEAAISEASQLGERLRACIERAGPVSAGRAAVSVTVSVGVAVLWVRPGDILKAPERLLAAADDALYRAKRNGRNRVEVAAP